MIWGKWVLKYRLIESWYYRSWVMGIWKVIILFYLLLYTLYTFKFFHSKSFFFWVVLGTEFNAQHSCSTTWAIYPSPISIFFNEMLIHKFCNSMLGFYLKKKALLLFNKCYESTLLVNHLRKQLNSSCTPYKQKLIRRK
jgi:purine-cytosine permease-like protein